MFYSKLIITLMMTQSISGFRLDIRTGELPLHRSKREVGISGLIYEITQNGYTDTIQNARFQQFDGSVQKAVQQYNRQNRQNRRSAKLRRVPLGRLFNH